MKNSDNQRTRNGIRHAVGHGVPLYLGESIASDLQEVGERTDGGTTRSRILLTAIALFAERGYENLSMRALASHVGLKAPTLYNYYESKEQLLIESIELGMNDFFGCVLKDIESVPREDRLFEIIRRHAGYKMRHRLIARANDRLIDPQFARMFLPEEVAQYFIGKLTNYRHTVQELVSDYITDNSEVSAQLITISILSQCDRTAYWFNPEGALSVEQALQQVLIIVRRMLGPAANTAT